MGDVGSARYEPALLPPCPSIRVLSSSNCQTEIQPLHVSMNVQKFSTSIVNREGWLLLTLYISGNNGISRLCSVSINMHYIAWMAMWMCICIAQCFSSVSIIVWQRVLINMRERWCWFCKYTALLMWLASKCWTLLKQTQIYLIMRRGTA